MFRSFYTRLCLGILSSFVIIGLVMLWLADDLAKTYQQEVEQNLHINVAQLLVDQEVCPYGDLDHEALKQAFHSMMILVSSLARKNSSACLFFEREDQLKMRGPIRPVPYTREDTQAFG